MDNYEQVRLIRSIFGIILMLGSLTLARFLLTDVISNMPQNQVTSSEEVSKIPEATVTVTATSAPTATPEPTATCTPSPVPTQAVVKHETTIVNEAENIDYTVPIMAVIILVAVVAVMAFAVVMYKIYADKKKREMEHTEEILSTPLETFEGKLVDKMKKKYEEKE